MPSRETNIENTLHELSAHIQQLTSERNHWNQVAHDLYIAAAHANTCRTCRERSLNAMKKYEQSHHPKDNQ